MDGTRDLAKFGSDQEHLAALEAEVAACLSAFPLLRAQLRQTATQVEKAVVEVCDSFHSMVNRARESATQATASLSRGAAGKTRESGSQALVGVTHRILVRTEAASGMTQQTVQTMEEVEEQMRRITGSLQDVDAIARALGVLGLNANIEAARAGEHGRTFGVVAGETTKLAGAAAQISKSIQKIVEQLRKSVDDTSRKLRTVSTALSEDAQTSRIEVDEAVGVMTATEENLRHSVEHSVHSNESLANDIARAVVAMQFQDSMSQQVTHVVDALGEVEAGLSSFVSPGAVEIAVEQRHMRHDLAGRLLSRYTMQSERDTHAAHLGIPINGTGTQSDNIELF
ncbi:MAG: methyl-accepting chemotaxis protein [Pirellulaceae bacterium]